MTGTIVNVESTRVASRKVVAEVMLGRIGVAVTPGVVLPVDHHRFCYRARGEKVAIIRLH